jgi:hypothetical protein
VVADLAICSVKLATAKVISLRRTSPMVTLGSDIEIRTIVPRMSNLASDDKGRISQEGKHHTLNELSCSIKSRFTSQA